MNGEGDIGCEGYTALARVYDQLNAQIDYEAWADFVEDVFCRFLPKKPELVLDLACGTGNMTFPLAARGYDMIGVDGSAEMLSVAVARAEKRGAERPLFLQQDMRAFELYGTVGAVTSCLDSVNYLLTETDLRRCFSLVHNYLDPDGLFLFDVNTPYKFAHTYGNNAYILEEEMPLRAGGVSALYCGWQNEFHPESGLCDFYLSVFEETENGAYLRQDEHQQERCYSPEQLQSALIDNGFSVLGVYGDQAFSAPTPTTERLYFVARALK